MFGVPNLRNIVTGDIAIDLGTANTLVWIKGQGIVLRNNLISKIEEMDEEESSGI